MIKHSDEFKQVAVRIALTSGLSRERVAKDLGIGQSTLGKWLEPPRDCRRPFGLSYAAMAVSSSMA